MLLRRPLLYSPALLGQGVQVGAVSSGVPRSISIGSRPSSCARVLSPRGGSPHLFGPMCFSPAALVSVSCGGARAGIPGSLSSLLSSLMTSLGCLLLSPSGAELPPVGVGSARLVPKSALKCLLGRGLSSLLASARCVSLLISLASSESIRVHDFSPSSLTSI